MKSVKRQITKEIEKPNDERSATLIVKEITSIRK